MHALLVQTEGCVNSQPITPIYDDPFDSSVLTSAHFRIDVPPANIPGPALVVLRLNRLLRWQMVQKMFQYPCKRWRQEHLHYTQ
ncbi:hypothetical protein Trydic_g21177 [Trypoxylus dichotomus]